MLGHGHLSQPLLKASKHIVKVKMHGHYEPNYTSRNMPDRKISFKKKSFSFMLECSWLIMLP